MKQLLKEIVLTIVVACVVIGAIIFITFYSHPRVNITDNVKYVKMCQHPTVSSLKIAC